MFPVYLTLAVAGLVLIAGARIVRPPETRQFGHPGWQNGENDSIEEPT